MRIRTCFGAPLASLVIALTGLVAPPASAAPPAPPEKAALACPSQRDDVTQTWHADDGEGPYYYEVPTHRTGGCLETLEVASNDGFCAQYRVRFWVADESRHWANNYKWVCPGYGWVVVATEVLNGVQYRIESKTGPHFFRVRG